MLDYSIRDLLTRFISPKFYFWTEREVPSSRLNKMVEHLPLAFLKKNHCFVSPADRPTYEKKIL
jgi:hypothetical protein